MKRWIGGLIVFLALLLGPNANAVASEIEYPKIIKARYAVEQKLGGGFVTFSERERIFHDLDAKLSPGARFVDATQIARTVGSTMPTFVVPKTVATQVRHDTVNNNPPQ